MVGQKINQSRSMFGGIAIRHRFPMVTRLPELMVAHALSARGHQRNSFDWLGFSGISRNLNA
jgi:hypothetical protein